MYIYKYFCRSHLSIYYAKNDIKVIFLPQTHHYKSISLRILKTYDANGEKSGPHHLSSMYIIIPFQNRWRLQEICSKLMERSK